MLKIALLLLPLQAGAATPSMLAPELNTFLGKPPAGFEKKFLQPARQLRKAMDLSAEGKKEAAIKILLPLSKQGELSEHASYALTQIYRDKKEFDKSTALVNRMLYEYVSSPYRDSLEDTLDANDCDEGLAESKKKGKQAKAREFLFRCLQKTPWRGWIEKEAQAEALYQILRKPKDPLFGPFVTELIQALPPSSNLRGKLRKDIPDAELNGYASVARFRTKSDTPAGVPAINPDSDLFDKGMLAVLEGRWSDANGIFKQMPVDFPQSVHLDRAKYWVARSNDALGYQDDAKKIYEEIYAQDPLSYYGLQSALRLKRDPALLITPAEEGEVTMQGSLLPRQILAIWRLRALIEEGLIEQARAEAKALFQYRPGGFTFGQENPAAAALTSLLFHSAGYSLAAFSHAYAAISLEPKQLNTFTLDLIFPNSFRKEFEQASKVSNVHPLLLHSVAKQESAFLPRATSRANALGLMQLLLSTARELDSKLDREKLFVPEVNAEVGSRYLQKLLDRYGGNIALALAGYNAGPSRASQWQKKMMEYESMQKVFDIDTFIDTIPFTETRKYVSSILRNYAWYKLLNKDGAITSIEELAFQWQKPKTEEPPVTTTQNR
jgi:soluble lytic murein transglycosylase